MGVSASAKVIVGFEVHHDDFWTEQRTTDKHASCPNGHTPPNASEKFCSQCGGKFERQIHTRLVANPKFANLVGDHDPQGKAGKAWDPEVCGSDYEQCSASGFGVEGLDLHVVDASEDYDRDAKVRALGFSVHSMIDIMDGGHGTPDVQASDESQLGHFFSEARELANKLGIDRPVLLYLATSAG